MDWKVGKDSGVRDYRRNVRADVMGNEKSFAAEFYQQLENVTKFFF